MHENTYQTVTAMTSSEQFYLPTGQQDKAEIASTEKQTTNDYISHTAQWQ